MKKFRKLFIPLLLVLCLSCSTVTFAEESRTESTENTEGSKSTEGTETTENTESTESTESGEDSQSTETEEKETDPVTPPVAMKQGLKKEGGAYYYYVNNKKVTKKWKTIKKKTYYFGSNGKAVTGTQKISHYYCKFTSKGVLYRKIDMNKKVVALTYDDGPSKYTPIVLDALEKYDAVATFFVVGERVPWYKKYVKRASSMGCEIGNHTYEHVTLTKLSKKKIKSQISKTNAIVKEVTGKYPTLVRAPGGAQNKKVKSTVNLPLILWSLDTLDWKYRNSNYVYKTVIKNVKDGDIVLMHDLHKTTAKAQERIIKKLKKMGYQFVTVSELAEIRGNGLEKGKSYSCFYKKTK